MNARRTPSLAGAVLAALAALAITAPARADDHGPRVAPPPAYLQECGACHVPFPARSLPAASWRRLMMDLPHHFGTDASLDPATERELGAWLQARAGSPSRVAEPPQDRLTRSNWFVREHDEVPTALWRSAAVGKASNCAACHTRAAEGRFGEHEIRLPR